MVPKLSPGLVKFTGVSVIRNVTTKIRKREPTANARPWRSCISRGPTPLRHMNHTPSSQTR